VKTFIIIPAFNENFRAVDTIDRVLRETKNDLIVIDDGSSDDTWKVLINKFRNNDRITLLSHAINLGKGAAMRTGVAMAWKMKGDSVVFIDADGQHNPKHLKDFEKELLSNDLVFGYRKLNGEMPFVRKWGNIIAKSLLRFLFNIKRKEFLCGYLGFKKSIYKQIKWSSTRYGVETEIATRVGKYQLKYSEIEVDTIYIDKYKGVSIFDAIKILLQIPIWYYN
jgi:glycosyltransferase involved in cell wall biosynthesis